MADTPGPIAAAILAGGQGRRMQGENKALLRIGGERIVDRQLRSLRDIAAPVFIVAGDPAPFADLGVDIFPDLLPGAGPMGGVHTALTSSPCARTIVVACDLPYLPIPLLRRLAEPSDAQLVIPRSERGLEPLCAAWSASAAGVLARRIQSGELKMAAVVEELRVEVIEPADLASFDPDGLLLVNVNTPHDYERARRIGPRESKSSRDRIMDVS